MISFTLSESKERVVVKVDPMVANQYYAIEIVCNDRIYASLLLSRLNEELRTRTQRIRREAYNQGFKDGRAKRKKQEFFGSGL